MLKIENLTKSYGSKKETTDNTGTLNNIPAIPHNPPPTVTANNTQIDGNCCRMFFY